MSEFNTILDTISGIIHRYNSGEFIDQETLLDMHRELSSNLYFLQQFECSFKDDWDAAYLRSAEKTDAAKKRYAEREVPQWHYAKRLYDAGDRVLMSIGTQLKYK